MAIASTPTVAAGGKEFGLQTTIYTNRKIPPIPTHLTHYCTPVAKLSRVKLLKTWGGPLLHGCRP